MEITEPKCLLVSLSNYWVYIMYQSFYQGRPKQIKTSIPDWSSESDGEHSVTHQVEIVRDLCCSRLRPLPSALEGVVVQSIPNFD